MGAQYGLARQAGKVEIYFKVLTYLDGVWQMR
jgi:hypothetical protein